VFDAVTYKVEVKEVGKGVVLLAGLFASCGRRLTGREFSRCAM